MSWKAWVKLDNGFRMHRKVLRAGADGVCLWVCGIDYCNEQPARDGFIPSEAVQILYPMPRPMKVAQRLVDVGLWEITDGGFSIHDYHVYQPTPEKAAAVSAKRAEAGRRGGQRSGEARRQRSEAEAHGKQIASPEDDRCFDSAEANANPVPVPVSDSGSSGASEFKTVAPPDPDDGRSIPEIRSSPEPDAVLEAELQQLFADAMLRDPVAEFSAFWAYYRRNPPGEQANWLVLAEAWIRGTATKGEVGDRRQRRGPQAVRTLLDGIGQLPDDPEALRKAELGVQAQRLRAAEGGGR